jgi:hypothetical protein
LSAGKSFLCSSKETVRPQKHLLVIRRKYKKSTKFNKENHLLKAKQLDSCEEGKTVLQNVLLCFIVILADYPIVVIGCHMDLEVVGLGLM